MPFDSTTVIPADWSRHHQGAVVGGMTAAVTVGAPTGEKSYDPETDTTTQAFSADYTGPARVQPIVSADRVDAAGQDLVGRPYLVQLDARHPGADALTPGMRVRVTAASADALLVGQDLWVVDVQLASERFTRDLVCSDNQTDTPATTGEA